MENEARSGCSASVHPDAQTPVSTSLQRRGRMDELPIFRRGFPCLGRDRTHTGSGEYEDFENGMEWEGMGLRIAEEVMCCEK
jgi:hypothetical protein